jgi:hypothetical protein
MSLKVVPEKNRLLQGTLTGIIDQDKHYTLVGREF